MPTDPRTDKQRLADLLLKEPVEDWIIRHRPGLAWDKIAAELGRVTKGSVVITGVTCREWVLDRLDETATADTYRADHRPVIS